MSIMQAALKKFSLLIPIVMLPLGAWLGYRTLDGRSFAEVWDMVSRIPALNLAFAFACAAGSYVCLTGFDTLAVRAIGRKLPYHKIALTSFVSLGIGHTVGVAVLSSGALRYRLYSGFGLRAGDVGKIVVLCGLTVGLGLMTLAGLMLVIRPDIFVRVLDVSAFAARAIGTACLLLSALYVTLAWKRTKPLTVRGHELYLPSVGIALAQIAVGTVNFALVAGALHMLLAGDGPYTETVAAYVAANISGLISHVPGGIGVLEFVISKLVAGANVIGALIAFRIVYFLVPLVLAITLLIASELARSHGSRRAARATG